VLDLVLHLPHGYAIEQQLMEKGAARWALTADRFTTSHVINPTHRVVAMQRVTREEVEIV
jgi:hypothetical protein